ncbi:MAG: 50S ribosomal protein L24 [Chloroflexi bacterium]|nr:50S ribosomal protein L24 [Chloroflexota bacterium]
MKVRKDDTVLVVRGKDRGKRGKVHRLLLKHERVLVEGVNITKRHVRPRPGVLQAGIVERETPLPLANVILICPKCDKPVRVGFKFLEDGKKVRVCRSCHETID